MVNQPKWGAKLALVCVLALMCVVLTVYGIVGFGLFQFTSWHMRLDLPFPIYIVVVPFARYTRASLKELGLKILASTSVALIPLFLLTAAVTGVLTGVFGPDPI